MPGRTYKHLLGGWPEGQAPLSIMAQALGPPPDLTLLPLLELPFLSEAPSLLQRSKAQATEK